MFKSGPDVTMASRTGQPNLNPPSEGVGGESLMVPSPGSLSVSGTATAGAPVTTVPTAPGAASVPGTSQPAGAGEKISATDPAKPLDITQKSKADLEKEKKEKEKKEKESSSKKKKGLRRLIPW
jgi:hypothetical protein